MHRQYLDCKILVTNRWTIGKLVNVLRYEVYTLRTSVYSLGTDNCINTDEPLLEIPWIDLDTELFTSRYCQHDTHLAYLAC